MPDMAFDLRFLNYVFLVAEHGSIRRAADVLSMSQSTVSRRIALLERRIGVRLFDRKRTGVRLTAAGERFVRHAEFGADYLRQAVNEMSLIRRGELGEIRIGLLASLARGKLGEILGQYHLKYPDIDVKIEETSSESAIAAVLTGRLDAVFLPGEPSQQGLESMQLWDEQIYVAMSDQHRLARHERVFWKDLQNEQFIINAGAQGPEVEGILIRQLSTLGFKPNIIVHRVGRETLLSMVGKRFGVTLVGDSTRGVSYPGTTFVPLESEGGFINTSMTWSAHNENPALLKLHQLSFATAALRPSEVDKADSRGSGQNQAYDSPRRA